MKPIERYFNFPKNASYLALLITLAGGAVCVINLWRFAHTQASFMDEGAFLVMGSQFIKGDYHPYLDYGPWMNYAPLSYLIPGAIQFILGLGLLSGRYFSVVLAVLAIIALCLVAGRLAGKWWAACIVWAFAATPYLLKVYSHVLSEVIVAFFLSWSLFFVLGSKRHLWQIISGSLFAGLAVMTRHTMFPLIPFLVFYVFWQHGKKAGWWSVVGCLFPVLILHAIFWPNILQIWSFYWLPTSWIPFLGKYKPITENFGSLYGNMDFRTQLLAFFSNFQANYLIMLGWLASLILWPSRENWKDQTHRRAAIFLVSLFFTLLVVHAAGSLGFSACPFCFSPYTTFFGSLAMMLVAVSFPFWRRIISPPRQVLVVILLIFIFFGIGAAASEQLGPGLLQSPVPRVNSGIRLNEWVTLWDYMNNTLKLDFFDARIVVSISFCIGIVAFLFFGILLFRRVFRRRKNPRAYSFGTIALLATLGGGFIVSPILKAPYYDCNQDVVENNESIGLSLQEKIPPGSRIYWAGSSAIPLTYLKEIKFNPAQVYGMFTFLLNQDTDLVDEAGYWNDGLDKLWFSQADFIIIEQDQLSGKLNLGTRISDSSFDLTILPPPNPCKQDNPLLVYKRIH